MKTLPNNEFPEIGWEDLKQDLLESDSEERMQTYLTTGLDTHGCMYFGSAVFVCGEFEKIIDIEKVSPADDHS